MAEPDKRPVTLEELLVSSLAQTDALAKLLIEKGGSRTPTGHYQEKFSLTQRLTERDRRENPVAIKACHYHSN